MSLWNFLDDGFSMPPSVSNWKGRLLRWLGFRFARRHAEVIVPDSCKIHPGAKIHPRKGRIVFGENCIVAEGAIIQGNVRFGDNCSVQSYSILVGYGSVGDDTGLIRIGNGVRIASHGMMIAANHVFDDPDKSIHEQGLKNAPITIEDDVWIGGRVNITAGVTIGTGSVIGGGAVVTKNIPPRSVAVGIPAKVVKQR